ncbi:MAG: hydrogenase nickel incorporation protein HypB [Deltaproteobacteria bacterium]|nr:hydrogenase nickel incorporation protein HypB [Deltaproteobacteria bacterium]
MSTIRVVQNILDANERIAANNRTLFDQKNIYVINLMSSPGAGKTTLVEKTIEALRGKYRIAVIEGDIQDTVDADRVAKLGIPAVQINTGGACHIDGNMIQQALSSLDLDRIDLLICENVGNLVCPAEFKVGENAKVMILSTPEGADKPGKYPLMFRESAVMILNKMDLLPYVDFDMAKAKRDALKLNPSLAVFEVSCRTGSGLEGWVRWLGNQIESFKNRGRE